jgi:hypothetical protein
MHRTLKLASAFTGVVLALAIAQAQAHHSLAGQFDTAKSFERSGVISRVDWVNPHTYVYVDVKQPDNTLLTFKLESLPVAMMRKAGLSKQELLGDGKTVHFKAHPARNGTVTLGYLLVMKLADGREIQFSRVPGAEDPAGAPR